MIRCISDMLRGMKCVWDAEEPRCRSMRIRSDIVGVLRSGSELLFPRFFF